MQHLEIKPRKGMRLLSSTLDYIPNTHKYFAICNEFERNKYAIKAMTEKGSETVIAVCKSKQMAKDIIINELNGIILPYKNGELIVNN